MALSKKAKQFVGSYKIKAQKGLQFPYVVQQGIGSGIGFAEQIGLPETQLDPTDLGMGQPLELGPDLSTDNSSFVSRSGQPKEKSEVEKVSDALGMLSPALKIGVGVSNFVQGLKEKKAAKVNEKLFREDYLRRKEKLRDSFYTTPYTVGRSDDLTMKNGGQLQTVTLYQNGGMNMFADFYNNQEKQKRNYLNNIQDFYKDTIASQKQYGQSLFDSGLNQSISGVTGLIETAKKAASMAAGVPMEKGGIARKALLKKTINKYQQGGLLDSIWNSGSEMLSKASDTLLNLGSSTPAVEPKPEVPYIDSLLQSTQKGDALEKLEMEQHQWRMQNKMFGESSNKSKSKPRFLEKQEGGFIDEDLYSNTFNPGYDNSSDSFNDLIEAEQTQMMQDQAFENDIDWILQDSINREQSESAETHSIKSNQYTPRTFGNVIDKIGRQESGNNYAAWNETSNTVGKYQFMESKWADEIKTFMDLPPQLTPRQVMKAFQNSPKSQDAFMQHVVETKYKPVLPEMRELGKQYGFTDDDLIRMMHYRGIADTRKRLKTGDFQVSESEQKIYRNPQILDYLNR